MLAIVAGMKQQAVVLSSYKVSLSPENHQAIHIPGRYFVSPSRWVVEHEGDPRQPAAKESLKNSFALLSFVAQTGRLAYFDVGALESIPKRIDDHADHIARQVAQGTLSNETERLHQNVVKNLAEELRAPRVEFKEVSLGAGVLVTLRTFTETLSKQSPQVQELVADMVLGAIVDGYKLAHRGAMHQHIQVSPRPMLQATMNMLFSLVAGEKNGVGKVLRSGFNTSIAQNCLKLRRAFRPNTKLTALNIDGTGYRECRGMEAMYRETSPQLLGEAFTCIWEGLLPQLAARFRHSKYGPSKDQTLALLKQPPASAV